MQYRTTHYASGRYWTLSRYRPRRNERLLVLAALLVIAVGILVYAWGGI